MCVLIECEQFVDRTLLLMMPVKYQPDYIYLRHVQTSRVHYFTLIQITCSAVMWAVKSIKATSIAFPLMVGYCRSLTSLYLYIDGKNTTR